MHSQINPRKRCSAAVLGARRLVQFAWRSQVPLSPDTRLRASPASRPAGCRKPHPERHREIPTPNLRSCRCPCSSAPRIRALSQSSTSGLGSPPTSPSAKACPTHCAGWWRARDTQRQRHCPLCRPDRRRAGVGACRPRNGPEISKPQPSVHGPGFPLPNLPASSSTIPVTQPAAWQNFFHCSGKLPSRASVTGILM